ncbi:quinoprotein dehydrogenase-associated SoxYZ-like carrier [Paracoccus seriniphilus]|uniref:quinoprotein dehydrogenase-associated SoxYZ-like carrier n=1 Tax=Paracoccus seriniphilus TaxID=184748 RepID=UPI00356AE70A
MGSTLTYLLPGGQVGLAEFRGNAPVPASARIDPFDSGMWPDHRRDFLDDPQDWRHDPALLVLTPPNAEDPGHVPVLVDATALDGPVDRIVVSIDYSPLPKVLVFHPLRALPFLGFGVKYEIGSPLRASVRMADGSWRMGASFVDAAGGGCTAPAAAHSRPDWQQDLGQMRGRIWPAFGRLRLTLRHPMDTGLADGISAHHLTELTLADDAGPIARLEIFEPVEEDPGLTFLLPKGMTGPVRISARDNLGYQFNAEVSA